MPRIAPLDPAQTDGKAKALLDGVQKALGMTPNLVRTLAHAPAALQKSSMRSFQMACGLSTSCLKAGQ